MPQLSLHTPVGDITVFEEDGSIVSLDWGWVEQQDHSAVLEQARDQLQAYFDRALKAFDLPLAPAGSTYQRKVWKALCDIPYGETRTYLDIVSAAGGRQHPATPCINSDTQSHVVQLPLPANSAI